MRRCVPLFSLLFVVPIFAALQRGPEAPQTRRALLVADFNHDGLDDAIDGDHLLLNVGGTLVEGGMLGIPPGSIVSAVFDANGDGLSDLLASTTFAGVPGGGGSPSYTEAVYLGTGGLTFQRSFTAPAGSRLSAADFDGDGRADLVAVRADILDSRIYSHTFTFLRSAGDGTFVATAEATILGDSSPQVITAGDLTNDGHADVVARFTDDLYVFKGHGDGTFDAPIDRYLPGRIGFGSMQFGDFDGDGNADILILGQKQVRVFFGDGRGNLPRFASIKTNPGSFSSYTEPRNFALIHYSSTKRVDVATGSTKGDVAIYSYVNGAAKEVTRVATGMASSSVYAGSFRSATHSDLVVDANGFVPVLYYATEAPANEAPALAPRSPGRVRASRAAPSVLALNLIERDDCSGTSGDGWRLEREGFFASDHSRSDRQVDAVIDDGMIFFRHATRAVLRPTESVLSEIEPGHYIAYAAATTTCGTTAVVYDARVAP